MQTDGDKCTHITHMLRVIKSIEWPYETKLPEKKYENIQRWMVERGEKKNENYLLALWEIYGILNLSVLIDPCNQ